MDVLRVVVVLVSLGISSCGSTRHAGSISNMDEKSVSHGSDLSSSKLCGSARSLNVGFKVLVCSPLLVLDRVCST
jgi:hypothetical protein